MKLRSILLLGAAGVAAFAAPAFADDGIEVVTVTAAKREQNVQDVPISMNVIQQKDLEKNNLSDLKDISSQIPGMVFLKTNNISTVSLRGFGSSAANPAIDQTVALYMDGIFAGRAREYMLPFFDVARMEVLRGPQGALLGKNTAAGAINIVSANPKDEFEASATVSYLIDRKGVDAFGYVTGPVLDDLSARLAVKVVSKSGWVHNVATNTDVPEVDSRQGRLTLQWQPSESFNMITKFGYENQVQEGKAISGYPTTTLRGQIGTTQNSPGLFGRTDHDYQNGYHFSNTATASFDHLTFVSITGVEAYTSNVITTGLHMAPETIAAEYIDDFNQVSQEFRLLSPTGQTFEWIAGIYADYSSQRQDTNSRYSQFPLAGFDLLAVTQFKQTAYTYSAYATGTWHATDALSLIVGARGTQVHKTGSADIAFTYFTPPPPPFGFALFGPDHVARGTIDETSFDPSVTLQYKVTDDVMVYAGWSKGSKGGAFQGSTNSITSANFAVKPEVSNNFEVGIKSTWWDWLTFNATAYYLKFKNLQAGQYTGTPPVLITKNAAEAESKGIEVVMNANLGEWVEGLGFSLTGNYIDAHYTDYPGASCTFAASQVANGGCGLNPFIPGTFTVGPNAGQLFNAKGLRFGALPVWQGTMQVNYTRPIMDGLKVELNLTADMQSSYWDDAGVMDARYGLQNGNTKLHFRIGVADEEDRWSLAVIGRNVNDVLTTSAGVYAIPPARVYAIDEGRSISIQGSVKVN